MCMCANLYRVCITIKACFRAARCIEQWKGRWAQVLQVRQGGNGFFGGWGRGVEKHFFHFCCSLATAQHLCSTLVGLINPGLIGISLEEKRGRGSEKLSACSALCSFSGCSETHATVVMSSMANINNYND